MKKPETTITHINGGILQALMEAVKEDGLLSEKDEKHLAYLKSLPPNRTELVLKP